MRTLRLLSSETRYQLLMLVRNPLAASFTLVFPLLIFLLLALLEPGGAITALGGIRFVEFATPAIGVFAVATAGYTNLAISLAIDRDEGILKRIRGTPMPPAVYLGSRMMAAILAGLGSVVVMVAIGMEFFDVALPARLATAVAILALGALVSCILGVAVAGAAPNGQAAPALANATILPLAFISGVFFPIEEAPGWVETVAMVFPLRPFLVAFTELWNPTLDSEVPVLELSILVMWAALGIVLAVRTFTWEPRPGGRRRSRP